MADDALAAVGVGVGVGVDCDDDGNESDCDDGDGMVWNAGGPAPKQQWMRHGPNGHANASAYVVQTECRLHRLAVIIWIGSCNRNLTSVFGPEEFVGN